MASPSSVDGGVEVDSLAPDAGLGCSLEACLSEGAKGFQIGHLFVFKKILPPLMITDSVETSAEGFSTGFSAGAASTVEDEVGVS